MITVCQPLLDGRQKIMLLKWQTDIDVMSQFKNENVWPNRCRSGREAQTLPGDFWGHTLGPKVWRARRTHSHPDQDCSPWWTDFRRERDVFKQYIDNIQCKIVVGTQSLKKRCTSTPHHHPTHSDVGLSIRTANLQALPSKRGRLLSLEPLELLMVTTTFHLSSSPTGLLYTSWMEATQTSSLINRQKTGRGQTPY